MGIKTDDIIDESKNNDQSCGLVVKVIEGGAGFEKLACCSYELDGNDLVENWDESKERSENGAIKNGAIIDESKNYPNSCGLKVKVLAGGAGFRNIACCGNVLTGNDVI